MFAYNQQYTKAHQPGASNLALNYYDTQQQNYINYNYNETADRKMKNNFNNSTNNVNQWYSCSNLTNITKSYVNGSSDGRSSSAFDSCDSLNTVSSHIDNNTIIYKSNNKLELINRQSTPIKMQQISTAVCLANKLNTTPRTRLKSKDLQQNFEPHWRSANQFESHSRRNTPVMISTINSIGMSPRILSPKSTIASLSSFSSSSSNTTTTSSSAESDAKNMHASGASINYQKKYLIESKNVINNLHLKNRHSLITDQNPQKLENFVGKSLVRKTSLPPEKPFKQLQIYMKNANINNGLKNQKPYSNLYPDDNEKRVERIKHSPKLQHKSIANQNVWTMIKGINELPPHEPSSPSPENAKFQQADFTPQLHRQKPPTLRRKPSCTSQDKLNNNESALNQSQQHINIYTKKITNGINNKKVNHSFENSAIPLLTAPSPKPVLTRTKFSNESLIQHQHHEEIVTRNHNVSTLRKFFKDNNPFDSLINKFNSPKIPSNNQECVKIEEKIMNVKNSNSNDTISNENVNTSDAKLQSFSVEKLEKKRKYKTLTCDKKKVYLIDFCF